MDNKMKTLFKLQPEFVKYFIALTVILFLSIYMKLQILAVIVLLIIVVIVKPDIPNSIRRLIKSIKWGDKEVQFRLREGETEGDSSDNEKPNVSSKAKELFDKGNLLFFSGNNDIAIEMFRLAIEHEPKFSDAYINLAAAYLNSWHKTGKEEYLEMSIEASRKALEIEPNGYRSRINLAVALSKFKKYEVEALKLYEEADNMGDLRDSVTWAKIKLFRAETINRLSERPEGKEYIGRLPEAELLLLEASELFDKEANNPEAKMWKEKLQLLLETVQKKIKLFNGIK